MPKPPPPLLEVCIDSLASARAAVQGGAGRLEVCSSLAQGGLSPSIGLLRMLQRVVCEQEDQDGGPRPPLFCMVRPRDGNYTYSSCEVELMFEEIKAYRSDLADGVVLGLTDGQGGIQRGTLDQMCKVAHPMRVTFHRAFDTVQDPITTLNQLSETTGVDRVLTSGQASSALEGLPLLRTLTKHASTTTLTRPISIMPGGSITPDNLLTIAQETGAREFHASASITQTVEDPTPPKRTVGLKVTQEETVRKLVNLLKKL